MSDDPNWNIILDLVSIGLSEIPYVGSFAALLLEKIWPATGPSLLDQLKTYVDQRLRQLADELRVEDFRRDLNGLQQQFGTLRDAGSTQERREAFETVRGTCDFIRGRMKTPDGKDEQPIANMLPYVVTFCTIRLAVLRYRFENYNAIYGEDNDKPEESIEEIAKDAAAFESIVAPFVQNAVNWRKSLITKRAFNTTSRVIAEDTVQDIDPDITQSWIEVKDSYTGYLKNWNAATNRLAASVDYSGRLDDCDTDFRETVEKLVAGHRYFASFVPGVKPPAPRPAFTWYNVGHGLGESGRAFNDREYFERYGRITKIRIWAGDWVDGMQVWYGGVSPGLRGRQGGSLNEISLADGENMNVMGGVIGDWVVSFWVKTNLNQNPCGGSSTHPPGVNDNFWVGYPSSQPFSPFDASIGYFVGIGAPTRITHLKVGFYAGEAPSNKYYS
ncbi:hypothetical protein F5Y04DRAFT_266212 [Hypomontagnella monticulosa]|nr:hypothetical protein F5Y04DRAFT_266212 [Hypomontagnella monticulosa]